MVACWSSAHKLSGGILMMLSNPMPVWMSWEAHTHEDETLEQPIEAFDVWWNDVGVGDVIEDIFQNNKYLSLNHKSTP